VTGPAGLLEAVTGVQAVIHAATSPFRRAKATEVGGTRRVLHAAESAGAHLVYPSIVGVDQISATYYQAKWLAEQLVESGGRWTIQRATQFHPMIDRMLSHRLFPVTRHLAFQPVDAGELAERLIDLVEAGPAGRAEDFGGPKVLSLRAMDAGRHLCLSQASRRVTWQTWLTDHPNASDHQSRATNGS
jgi:nucleoside-diphosphate-sugar epimerase